MTKEQASIYYAWRLLQDIECGKRECSECPLAILNNRGGFSGCMSVSMGKKLQEWGIISKGAIL